MQEPETVTTPNLDAYLAERNAALTSMDMKWAEKEMPYASSPEVREVAMHKARYECTAIDRELRIKSYKWLKLRHYKRLTNDPLLPYGELPE